MENRRASHNAEQLHAILRGLMDSEAVLLTIARKKDARLSDTIFNLAHVLSYGLHYDGGFALFNGATEGKAEEIAQTLAKIRQNAEVGGYEKGLRTALQSTPAALMERSGCARLHAGETVVLVDVATPDYAGANGYYGTLSFEMGHGTQRYIVNCGAFMGNDSSWSRVVKTTAAHSAICVDDRNSCQFYAEVPSQHGQPHVEKRLAERDGYHFFEGAYNGYAPYAGLVHTRQLLINQDGTRFSGADHLQVTKNYENARSHDVHLRFHLHPAVQPKRLMNGMVELTLPGKEEVWTFHASVGQAVELEESIYLGMEGKPLSTTQIVIYVPFDPAAIWTVEWSFIKS